MDIIRSIRAIALGCGLVLLLNASAQSQGASQLPHLARQGSATQLIINGAPFLMRAGELGNSSSSNLRYMEAVWPRLRAMNLNTILVPVYWEMVEPAEGRWDFTLVDGLVAGARKQGMKIVVLWFGSWKNSMSCDAPAWVKQDGRRFPRARTADGRAVEILTPFSPASRQADERAFASLMRHLRETDSKDHTVILVQVENEIGMIPEARDHCPEADAAYAQAVPSELLAYIQAHSGSLTNELRASWNSTGNRTSGTWEEVFGTGTGTEEIFMAWHFAHYTNAVAGAGKKEYPLPMFVNAALIRPNYKPGQYPSAGPLPHLMDVWRAGGPQIDFLAPDIYFRNFAEWVGKFDREGNGMFVPEVDQRQSMANAFYVIGRHNSMGYSPFSIESAGDPEHNQFARGYDVLRQLTPLILDHQGTGSMTGFLLDSAAQTAQVQLGGYTFTVKHEYAWPYATRSEGETPRYGGLIIKIADDEFFIAGTGLVVTFSPSSNDGKAVAGIVSIDEGTFTDGTWVAGRRLNGDQSHQGRHLNLPGGEFGIQKVKLYTYR